MLELMPNDKEVTMLELMPIKEMPVKELAPFGHPAVEEFVRHVKKAYSVTGWKPVQGCAFANGEGNAILFGEDPDLLNGVGGCALGVSFKYDRDTYNTWHHYFISGVIDGFDDRQMDHDICYDNKYYIHGYKCGEAARKAVFGS